MVYKNICESEIFSKVFYRIIFRKLKIDGYIELGKYLKTYVKKQEYYELLEQANSDFKVLFLEDVKYPKADEFLLNFYKILKEKKVSLPHSSDLTDVEAEAIVYWIYNTFKKEVERREFTEGLASEFNKSINNVTHFVFEDTLFFDKNRVNIKSIYNLNDFNEIISNIIYNGHVFYRGHDNPNYMLVPSISRKKSWIKNEDKIYNEIQIKCPEEFVLCQSHLEKLVAMQHYHVPTRLLDITTNPLVALYFSCLNPTQKYGEVIIFFASRKDVKYPQSDTVSVLSSLSALANDKKIELKKIIEDEKIENITSDNASALVQEIRLEKPAFIPNIRKMHLSKPQIVYALQNNKRIVAQDGAFIICDLGIMDKEYSRVSEFRYREKNMKVDILIIKDKKKILKELDRYSINKSSLFPEIDTVAQYVRDKW